MDFLLQRQSALKNHNSWRWYIFLIDQPEGSEIKWRKKIRQTNFSLCGKKKVHFGISRRCAATASEHWRCNDYCRCFNRTFWDTPTLRSYSIYRSSDAVTELVQRCSVYWPNQLGWRQKVQKPLETFMILSWRCPLGHGKSHLTAIQFILTARLIPTPLSFH